MIFFKASSLYLFSESSFLSSSSFFLFSTTSSNYFVIWEGPAYLELVIGTAEAELASLFLAIDSSIEANDLLTLKS